MRAMLGLLAFAGALCTSRAGADEIRYLPNAREALATRLSLAQSASRTLDLSTFIWDPCSSSTKALVAILARKAKDGVRVRVLLDAFNPTHQFKQRAMSSEWRAAIGEQLRRAKIELKYYMDSGYLPSMNQRLHSKVMIADGATYIVGGRNMQDDYFGLAQGLNWVDREAAVSGASAKQAADGFEAIWSSSHVSPAKPASPESFKKFESSCLNATPKDKALGRWLEESAPRIAAAVPAHSCPATTYYVDDVSFIEGIPNEGEASPGESLTGERWVRKASTRAIAGLLQNAKKTIEMENFSFLPPARISEIFARKREARVAVDAYSNHSTDSRILDSRMESMGKKESEGSVRVWRLCPNSELKDQWELSGTESSNFWILHAKDMVVDGTSAVVSSWNLDARSYGTNIESAMIVSSCPSFAEAVRQPLKKHATSIAKRPRNFAGCRRPDGKTPTGWERFLGSFLQEWL